MITKESTETNFFQPHVEDDDKTMVGMTRLHSCVVLTNPKSLHRPVPQYFVRESTTVATMCCGLRRRNSKKAAAVDTSPGNVSADTSDVMWAMIQLE